MGGEFEGEGEVEVGTPIYYDYAKTVSRLDIYEVFIENWFKRNARKLIDMGRLPDDGSNPVEWFREFSIQLAEEMYKEGLTEVKYVPKSSSLFGNKSNKWDRFFGEEDPRMSIAKRGCPLSVRLEITGPLNSMEGFKFARYFRFIHSSIGDYFKSKAMARKLKLLASNSDPTGTNLSPRPSDLTEIDLSEELGETIN